MKASINLLVAIRRDIPLKIFRPLVMLSSMCVTLNNKLVNHSYFLLFTLSLALSNCCLCVCNSDKTFVPTFSVSIAILCAFIRDSLLASTRCVETNNLPRWSACQSLLYGSSCPYAGDTNEACCRSLWNFVSSFVHVRTFVSERLLLPLFFDACSRLNNYKSKSTNTYKILVLLFFWLLRTIFRLLV